RAGCPGSSRVLPCFLPVYPLLPLPKRARFTAPARLPRYPVSMATGSDAFRPARHADRIQPALRGVRTREAWPEPWRPQEWVLALVAGALVGLVIMASIGLFWRPGQFAAERYELWRWEAETLPMTFVGLFG